MKYFHWCEEKFPLVRGISKHWFLNQVITGQKRYLFGVLQQILDKNENCVLFVCKSRTSSPDVLCPIRRCVQAPAYPNCRVLNKNTMDFLVADSLCLSFYSAVGQPFSHIGRGSFIGARIR